MIFQVITQFYTYKKQSKALSFILCFIFFVLFLNSSRCEDAKILDNEKYSNEDLDSISTDDFQILKNTEENFKKDISIFIPKKPTPSRFFSADLSIPDNFGTTNNLAKKTGSFYRSFGEVIFLQGNVTDSFGVPIENAVIEIWQTNAAGKYHTLLEENSEYIDKYFNMSGKAITDNIGNYHFITIMPGGSKGRAPHINMNIYHQKFGRLETEIYFDSHPYNLSDYQYLSYTEEERKALTAQFRISEYNNAKSIKLFTFNVVMKGVHQYKRH